MKLARTLLAAAAMTASVGASADVVGMLGGGSGTFLALSGPEACTVGTPCTLGPGVATIVGGTTYDTANPSNARPFGTNLVSGNFLSAGPTATEPSTMTFTTPVDYISFLWGSPDLYNMLTVLYTDAGGAGSRNFNVGSGADGLNFSVTNGNQSFAQYVEFIADMGTTITGLMFTNSPSTNAFETANFSVVRAVPEPETYALMLAGLGALGFIARRRKRLT